MIGSLLTAWKLATSPLGKRLLGALALVLAMLWAYHEFKVWKEGIYQQGYADGYVQAKTNAETARKAYFDMAQAVVKEIRDASVEAASRIEASNRSANDNVDRVVNNALQKWTKNPLIVYNEKEGKCALSPEFTEAWNAINREINK